MNWTPEKLTQLATGYWQSAALITAVKLGVFDAIADQSCTAGEVARRIGFPIADTSIDRENDGLPAPAGATAKDASDGSPENVSDELFNATSDGQMLRLTALLDAIVSIDLLSKFNGRYRIASHVQPLLCPGGPTCMLDALRYNDDLYQQWGQLTSVITTGRPAGGEKQLGQDAQLTRRFVQAMEAKARAFLPAILPLLDLQNAETLLDIGSGPGTLSRALAEQDETLHVTMYDLPPVIEVVRELCSTSAVTHRLKFHAGNYRTDGLPGPFDAVLYAGALHQETLESAAALFSKIASALKDGGRLFVIDLMLDDDRTSPVFSTLFQLNMLLIRPVARVFSRVELTDLLEKVGFSRIEFRQPEQSPYRVATACKPLADRDPADEKPLQ